LVKLDHVIKKKLKYICFKNVTKPMVTRTGCLCTMWSC